MTAIATRRGPAPERSRAIRALRAGAVVHWRRWPDSDPSTVLSLRSSDGARLLVRREWPTLDATTLRAVVERRAPRHARRLASLVHPRAATHSLQSVELAARTCSWAHQAAGRRPQVRWNARGRPEFAGPRRVRADLNLSHGAGVVAVAFDPCGRVGVDVEAPRRLTPALVEDTLAACERRWLDGASDTADRERRFARLWTLKEALAKCIGVGLELDPRDLVFEPAAPAPRLLRAPVRGQWRFTEFALADGAACAVCRGEPPRSASWRRA